MYQMQIENNQLGTPMFQENQQSVRAIEEVKAQIFMAKQFPRDYNNAKNRIIDNCKRAGLAKAAIFRLPRGGNNFVEGASIRLAEELARNWGNLEFGVKELESTEEYTKSEAYCWDMENNFRQKKEFTVYHSRKVRGNIEKVTDPAQIHELVNARASRYLRNCIIACIPSEIVESAVTQCKETMLSGAKSPLQDRIFQALNVFRDELGVTKQQIEANRGKDADLFGEADLMDLITIYNSIKEGVMTVEENFPKIENKPNDQLGSFGGQK